MSQTRPNESDNQSGDESDVHEQSDGIQRQILREYLDEYDYQIFKTLNKNGRMSDTELAERIGLSRTAVSRRREKLQEDGILDILAVIVLQETDLSYGDASIVLDQEATLDERNTLIEGLMDAEMIYSVDSCMGPYDLFVRGWHDSLGDLKSYFWELLEDREIVEEYQIIPVVDTWKAWDKELTRPD